MLQLYISNKLPSNPDTCYAYAAFDEPGAPKNYRVNSKKKSAAIAKRVQDHTNAAKNVNPKTFDATSNKFIRRNITYCSIQQTVTSQFGAISKAQKDQELFERCSGRYEKAHECCISCSETASEVQI